MAVSIMTSPFSSFLGKIISSSLLRSGSTTSYYEALSVDMHASTEEIARAYKKECLRLHPDKIRQQKNRDPTESEKDELQYIKKAHQVLVDVEKRAMYDTLGERGQNTTSMYKDIAENIKTKPTRAFAVIILILSICAIITAAPVLFCLKVDGNAAVKNTQWVLICIPLWIIDAYYLICVLSFFQSSTTTWKLDNSGTNTTPMLSPYEESFAMDKNVTTFRKILLVVKVGLYIAPQILVVCKLDGYLDSTPWLYISFPFIVYLLMDIFRNYLIQAETLPDTEQAIDEHQAHVRNVSDVEEGAKVNESNEDLEEAVNDDMFIIKLTETYRKIKGQFMARSKISQEVLMIAFLLLLTLKLDSTIEWNWVIIFIPMIMNIIGDYILAFAIDKHCKSVEVDGDLSEILGREPKNVMEFAKFAKAHHKESAARQRNRLILCSWQIILVVVLLLLILVKGDNISLFYVFIPIWATLFMPLTMILCFGLFLCCSCFAANDDGDGVSLHMHAREKDIKKSTKDITQALKARIPPQSEKPKGISQGSSSAAATTNQESTQNCLQTYAPLQFIRKPAGNSESAVVDNTNIALNEAPTTPGSDDTNVEAVAPSVSPSWLGLEEID